MADPTINGDTDRRNMERRIDTLERQIVALSTSVNEVKVEQKHHSEIVTLSFTGVGSRIDTVGKGNDLVVEKIDGLNKIITEAIGDSTKSPMGRELAKDIKALRETCDEQGSALEVLKGEAAELRGAVHFARSINIWSIVIGVGIVVAILIKLISSGKAAL